MAHFAQLDEQNTVIRVIVVHNYEAPDEQTGINFCKSIFGNNSIWKQTSYNSLANKHYNANGTLSGKPAFRYNFASVGHKYNPTLDAFYAPNPPEGEFNWTFDEEGQVWINNMKVHSV